MELERVTITIEKELLDGLDALIERTGLGNRSEAIRDLVRRRLVEESVASDRKSAVGTVTLVYDHSRRDRPDRLVDAGHDHHHEILSTLHVHLDEHHCLEVVAMRGRAGELRHIASHLLGMKGVLHGELVMTSIEV